MKLSVSRQSTSVARFSITSSKQLGIWSTTVMCAHARLLIPPQRRGCIRSTQWIVHYGQILSIESMPLNSHKTNAMLISLTRASWQYTCLATVRRNCVCCEWKAMHIVCSKMQRWRQRARFGNAVCPLLFPSMTVFFLIQRVRLRLSASARVLLATPRCSAFPWVSWVS